jgi:hypothetical protein
VKPSYILKVTYPIAAVMAKIHSLAVAMRAPRSMVLAVCDSASSCPAAAPILVVKKGAGSLCLVVDYWGINEGTIKNHYPLPLMQDTLMNLSRAKWFTKLDIRGAYNLI